MFKIIITNPDGVKNVVTREDVVVEFPSRAEAEDTAAWMDTIYPSFTFTVEAI